VTKKQPASAPATEHSLRSSYRESVLEHLFVGEVMKHLWLNQVSIEVLKPQVDDAGYDLVFEAKGIVRHVQLKSSYSGAKTSRVNVSLDLGNKPSGCVIWLWFNPGTLELDSFRWFGSGPGTQLPSIAKFKVAKHTKGNALGSKGDRPNLRVIPKKPFKTFKTIAELIHELFGPL